MSDHAKSWSWLVLLAVTCGLLSAVLSSAVGAHGGDNGYTQPAEDLACPAGAGRRDV